MKRVLLVITLATSALLPAQALAQAAPGGPAPGKAVVVVQTSTSSAPAAVVQTTTSSAPAVVVQTTTSTAPASVVVQTSTSSAPTAPAPKPADLPKPNLTIDVPAAATLGRTLTIQVNLVDPDGAPVDGATVDFATSATFLNTQSSVVFDHAVTNAQGSASIDWQPRSDGNVTLTASFAGDKRAAAANANATVQVSGDRQLYQQQAGVVLPGLNAAPPLTETAALAPVASPWPRMSGWPLVLVLAIVWSLYARAVGSLFAIARGQAPKNGGRERR